MQTYQHRSWYNNTGSSHCLHRTGSERSPPSAARGSGDLRTLTTCACWVASRCRCALPAACGVSMEHEPSCRRRARRSPPVWEAEGVRGRGVLAARARLGLAESFRRAADSARIRGGGATTTQSRTMMTKFRPRDAFWVQYRYKRQYATSIGAGPRDNSDSKVWNTCIKERSYAASSPGSQPIEFRPVATEAMGVGSNVAT